MTEENKKILERHIGTLKYVGIDIDCMALSCYKNFKEEVGLTLVKEIIAIAINKLEEVIKKN